MFKEQNHLKKQQKAIFFTRDTHNNKEEKC
jgi:hypothetical protein